MEDNDFLTKQKEVERIRRTYADWCKKSCYLEGDVSYSKE